MVDNNQTITIPDIGTDNPVEVIEINVKVGDLVSVEDPLITLESEKASMEIPSPQAGVVKSILVKVGDKVSIGSKILTIEAASAESNKEDNVKNNSSSANNIDTKLETNKTDAQLIAEHAAHNIPNTSQQSAISNQAKVKSGHSTEATTQSTIPVLIPDIGTDSKVVIIEIPVKKGDVVQAEDPLITLESEKATMDIPAPQAGTIQDIKVKVGDKVGYGDLILELTISQKSSSESSAVDNSSSKSTVQKTESGTAQQATASTTEKEANNKSEGAQSASRTQTSQAASGYKADTLSNGSSGSSNQNKSVYASPSVRRFANELGANLTKVAGTGRKDRITKSDVEQYVKGELAKIQSGNFSNTGTGLNVANMPEIDHSKFGQVTTATLTRIKKLSASNLHRNWVTIPHVTQFDEADITEMEEFRKKYKHQAESKGYKLTPLVFLMRAAAQALKLVPQFNVSLSNDGLNIIQKHYYHIGIAVDTPNGLVVPVVRDVDQKGLFQLAQELAEISTKAREGKLQARDMQGGCFTISSLGGIGGTAFTPIINAPEVAILGISKSQIKPVYQNENFVPRLMLPLSLSYDHRAIDGADAARFITIYSQLLGDISQLLL